MLPEIQAKKKKQDTVVNFKFKKSALCVTQLSLHREFLML